MLEKKKLHKRIVKRARCAVKIKKTSMEKLKVLPLKTVKHFRLQLCKVASGDVILTVDSYGKEFKDKAKDSKDIKSYNNSGALLVAEIFANKIMELKPEEDIVFDRGGYPFKGRLEKVVSHIKEKGIKI